MIKAQMSGPRYTNACLTACNVLYWQLWYFLVLMNLAKKDECNCASAYQRLGQWRASGFCRPAPRFENSESALWRESAPVSSPESSAGAPDFQVQGAAQLPRRRSGRTDARSADGRTKICADATYAKKLGAGPALRLPRLLELRTLWSC